MDKIYDLYCSQPLGAVLSCVRFICQVIWKCCFLDLQLQNSNLKCLKWFPPAAGRNRSKTQWAPIRSVFKHLPTSSVARRPSLRGSTVGKWECKMDLFLCTTTCSSNVPEKDHIIPSFRAWPRPRREKTSGGNQTWKVNLKRTFFTVESWICGLASALRSSPWYPQGSNLPSLFLEEQRLLREAYAPVSLQINGSTSSLLVLHMR